MEIDLSYISGVVGSIIVVLLLVLFYTYVDKLEKTGCECAKHPHHDFIKYYPIAAILFLGLTMFFPPAAVQSSLGKNAAFAYSVLRWFFVIFTVVFFVVVVFYLNNLIREKCRCSEDYRREISYIYSIIMVIVLIILFLLPITESVLSGALGLAVNTVKNVNSRVDTVIDTMRSPLKSLRSIPKNVKRIPKDLKKTFGKKR